MIPIYIRMITTALLSLLAVVLYLVRPCTLRKNCMLAMLVCSLGDVFMVNAGRIGEFSTFIGAGLFIAAHIMYGMGFYQEIKDKKQKIINSNFVVALVIMVSSVIGLLCFELTASVKKPVMFVLILLYISAIGYNVCSMFSYAGWNKKLSVLLQPAVVLFYITDIFIFFDMLEINSELRKYVWHFYPIAQLVIILCNSSLKRSGSVKK